MHLPNKARRGILRCAQNDRGDGIYARRHDGRHNAPRKPFAMPPWAGTHPTLNWAALTLFAPFSGRHIHRPRDRMDTRFRGYEGKGMRV